MLQMNIKQMTMYAVFILHDKNACSCLHTSICDYVTLFGDNRSNVFFVRSFGCALFVGGIIMKKKTALILVLALILGTFPIINEVFKTKYTIDNAEVFCEQISKINSEYRFSVPITDDNGNVTGAQGFNRLIVKTEKTPDLDKCIPYL
jgi:hypothetical protein